jgi:hypothetical protein
MTAASDRRRDGRRVSSAGSDEATGDEAPRWIHVACTGEPVALTTALEEVMSGERDAADFTVTLCSRPQPLGSSR